MREEFSRRADLSRGDTKLLLTYKISGTSKPTNRFRTSVVNVRAIEQTVQYGDPLNRPTI